MSVQRVHKHVDVSYIYPTSLYPSRLYKPFFENHCDFAHYFDRRFYSESNKLIHSICLQVLQLYNTISHDQGFTLSITFSFWLFHGLPRYCQLFRISNTYRNISQLVWDADLLSPKENLRPMFPVQTSVS